MKKIIVVFAVIFATSIVFVSCKSEKKEETKEEVHSELNKELDKQVYQCPMKCEKEKTYDKEGKCPVCKMKLRKTSLKDHKER